MQTTHNLETKIPTVKERKKARETEKNTKKGIEHTTQSKLLFFFFILFFVTYRFLFRRFRVKQITNDCSPLVFPFFYFGTLFSFFVFWITIIYVFFVFLNEKLVYVLFFFSKFFFFSWSIRCVSIFSVCTSFVWLYIVFKRRITTKKKWSTRIYHKNKNFVWKIGNRIQWFLIFCLSFHTHNVLFFLCTKTKLKLYYYKTNRKNNKLKMVTNSQCKYNSQHQHLSVCAWITLYVFRLVVELCFT